MDSITLGQGNEDLAKLHKPFSQHPEEVSQAHEVMTDGGKPGVLAVPGFRVIKLIVAQAAVAVAANNS